MQHWSDTLRKLALREKPAGLSLSPNEHFAEIGDPQNRVVTMARVRPLIEKHGGQIMMEDFIIRTTRRICYEQVDWILAPMDMEKEYEVPPSVYHRIQAIEAEGVVFHYWIYGEEDFTQPKLRMQEQERLRQQARETEQFRKADPIIIGVVYTDPAREYGIWCCLGMWLH